MVHVVSIRCFCFSDQSRNFISSSLPRHPNSKHHPPRICSHGQYDIQQDWVVWKAGDGDLGQNPAALTSFCRGARPLWLEFAALRSRFWVFCSSRLSVLTPSCGLALAGDAILGVFFFSWYLLALYSILYLLLCSTFLCLAYLAEERQRRR
jgi:hypothetical protein